MSDVVPSSSIQSPVNPIPKLHPSNAGFLVSPHLVGFALLGVGDTAYEDSVGRGRCKRALHSFGKQQIHWLWVCACRSRAASLTHHHLLQLWTLLLAVLIYKNEVAPNYIFCNQLAHDMFWDDLLLFYS